MADARRAADDLLGRAEREVAAVRRELTRQRNLRGGRGAASEAAAAFDELARRAATAREEARTSRPHRRVSSRHEEPESTPAIEKAQPRVGLFGRSRTLGTTGRIAAVSGRTGRVTLETNGARVVIPGEDVEIIPEPAAGPSARDVAADELRRRAAARVSPRLDLRGERVEAALEQLDAYLDEALLAGLDNVVILHGTGTGALRRAVRERLAEHPRVRGTRSGRREEGGDQATVAEL
jgi:DNA mismatch repair protein MutS2